MNAGGSGDGGPGWPPTVFVVHRRERRSKCSVEPLRGRPGFQFLTFPVKDRPPLAGYLRVGLGGPLLSPADRIAGLLFLDGNWRLLPPMEAAFADLPVRSLPLWRTAYPRRSKAFTDPDEGLATIEAVFAAYLEMGRDPAGLLDAYHWARPFLEANQERIARLFGRLGE